MKLLKNELTPPLVAISVMLAAGAAFGGLSSSSYVQSGLILQLDGIENVGRGQAHDSTATRWVDLSGKSGDAIINKTSPGWQDGNSIKFINNACADGESSLLQQAVNNKNATVEVVFSWIGNTALFWMGTDRFIGITGTGGYTSMFVKHGSDMKPGVLPAGTPQTLAFRIGDVPSVYTNGVLDVERAEASYYGSSQGTSAYGVCHSRQYENNYGNAIVYAVRCYDRALTLAELAANAAIDRVRFFGADGKVVAVGGKPLRLGTSSPAYGTSLQQGASVDFALDYELTDYPDGVKAISAGEGARAQFVGAEIVSGDSAPVTNAASSFTQPLTDDQTEVNWLFGNMQYQVSVSASTGDGRVSVDGGAPAGTASAWASEGGQVVLKAVSLLGNDFKGWTGDVEGIEDVRKAEITVPMTQARTLVAEFGTYIVDGGNEKYPVYESAAFAALPVETRVWTLSEPWTVPGFMTVPGGLLLMVR